MAKQSQIIFMNGKEKALKTLFSESTFGWLAVGYEPTDNGFEDPSINTEISNSGFNELEEANGYTRAKLYLDEESPVSKDDSSGKVLVKFKATFDETNIMGNQNINQIAIVDNSTPGYADTNFYAATTFPTFQKSQDSSITFIVGFRL